MSQQEVLYDEKQYLGRNRHMLIIRVILVAFCFAAYFWTRQKELSGDLFLVLGITILFFSTIMTFVTHFRTKLYETTLELEQYWQFRKVKLPLKNIQNLQVVVYERFKINNPVFNLHFKGKIHFYTTGDRVLKITDKDGMIYYVGSQQPERLSELIKKQMEGLV